MSKRLPTRGNHLRAAIAQEAARLMAEHGIQDYGVAKRKAAKRYGVHDGQFLPHNVEIEAALTSYQRMFGGQQHAENLRLLRAAAIKAMRLLAPFEPRLVGPVLIGTATAYSEVQLHVFSEPAEAVSIGLMDRSVPHELIDMRLRVAGSEQVTLPGLKFEIDNALIEVTVFTLDGLRLAPLSPADGRPMKRANLDRTLALPQPTP